MSSIELTVLIITYNHARFIEAAVESVLSQETDFDYEIIISEDCSTDGTRAILERLARAHPGRMELLLSEVNLNDNSVVRRGLEAARGRCVALLDGDDYWTSTSKLQTQLDFLDAHPACSSCFHNVNVVYDGGVPVSHLWHQDAPAGGVASIQPKPRSFLADIVRSNFIATCSVVFRAEVAHDLPKWYDDLAAGDWPLHVLSAQHGPIAYLEEVMATYRVHAGGLWTQRDERLKLSDVEDVARMYDVLDRHLEFAFRREVRQEVADLYGRSAIVLYKKGEYDAAVVCARRSLRRDPAAFRLWRWKSVAALLLSGIGGLRRRR